MAKAKISEFKALALRAIAIIIVRITTIVVWTTNYTIYIFLASAAFTSFVLTLTATTVLLLLVSIQGLPIEVKARVIQHHRLRFVEPHLPKPQKKRSVEKIIAPRAGSWFAGLGCGACGIGVGLVSQAAESTRHMRACLEVCGD